METLVIHGKPHFVDPEVYALVEGLRLETCRLRDELERAHTDVYTERALREGRLR